MRRPGLARRAVLGGLLGAAAEPARAQPASRPVLRPNGLDDQTAVIARMLADATRRQEPLRLPAGRYRLNGLRPPAGAWLMGTGSGTTLVQAGAGPIVVAGGPGSFGLSQVALEGAAAGDPGVALLRATDVAGLELCDIVVAGARGAAFRVERCAGRIERCVVAKADVAIHSLDATGLVITANTVSDCGNNGIQVWRSTKGHDGTQVLMNRIAGIRARSGGSGEHGNAINVFRADNVMVAQNAIRDCAFSAIRGNAADGLQIASNHCTNLGEVAIFVEFGSVGAVVANNTVDGASAGVSVTNSDHGGRLATIVGNLLRNLFRRADPLGGRMNQGYGIAAEASSAVMGNVVEGAEFAGIVLGYGPYLQDVLCANNIVSRCGVGIAVSVATGADAVQVSGNVLSGCRAGGIVGLAWDDVVEPDLPKAAARYPKVTMDRNTIR